MRVRKLGVFIAAVMVTLGLYVPSAGAQLVPPPIPPSGAALCVVSGFVDIDPGVVVPPAATGPGEYDFTQVALACAGSLLGVCFVTSDGTTQGDSPTSGFSGTFNSTAPCIPSNQNCAGNIGGPRLVEWAAGPPPTPTVRIGPGHPFPNPQWSFTAGPLLTASLDSVTCTGINIPPVPPFPTLTNGSGVFAAVAGPDPTKLEGDCGPAGAVRFCGIVIAGAAVIVWP